MQSQLWSLYCYILSTDSDVALFLERASAAIMRWQLHSVFKYIVMDCIYKEKKQNTKAGCLHLWCESRLKLDQIEKIGRSSQSETRGVVLGG